MLSNLIESERRRVVPIGDRESAEVFVIVGGRRSIDYDRAKDAIAILCRPVRVIPGCTELGCTKSVLACLAWSNRTFSNTWNTVVLAGV